MSERPTDSPQFEPIITLPETKANQTFPPLTEIPADPVEPEPAKTEWETMPVEKPGEVEKFRAYLKNVLRSEDR